MQIPFNHAPAIPVTLVSIPVAISHQMTRANRITSSSDVFIRLYHRNELRGYQQQDDKFEKGGAAHKRVEFRNVLLTS